MKILTRVRALPLGLISVVALVALVALSVLFAREPLQDAATFENLSKCRCGDRRATCCSRPFSNVLDTLTLLSLRQHIALLATILVCYVAWWWFFGRKQLAALAPNRRALREVARSASDS
jgi:hypothetical protein